MKKQQEEETILQINVKQEKGITLIALVITIIILIILATVTLNVVLGEGGLIDRAQQAKDLTEQAAKEEQEGLNSLMSEYTNIMSEDNINQIMTVIEAKNSGQIFEKITPLKDDTSDILYVPGGFGIAEDSATDIDDGVVITNLEKTKQFVWIPVSNESLNNMYIFSEEPMQLSGQDLGVEAKTNIYIAS